MMQMHPNLMCAAAVQCAFNQTGLLARTKNAIFSFGTRRGLNSRSFFADSPDVVDLFSITPVSFRNFPATRAR